MKKEIFRSSQFIKKGKTPPKKNLLSFFKKIESKSSKSIEALQWYFYILYLYNFSC